MDAIRQTFGKSLCDLTADEHRIYRQAARMASYYRKHEVNKKNQRRTKKFGKQDILKALGWTAKCMECGYDRYIGALDFHHEDPALKVHGVRKRGLAAAVEEARKCKLLCANCHREWHGQRGGTKTGGRPRKAMHPLVEKYLDAVGVVRPD
jgi:hypothetical protein